MQRHARLISRVASAGLGLVFVALIVCTIWGAVTIQRAAERTRSAVTFSQRYELVERQLLTEASFVRVHGLDPEGSGWYEERAAAVATEATLSTIQSTGGAKDRALAQRTTTDHDRYIDVLLVLFSQIDANAPEVPQTFKRSARIFDAMLGRIDARALEQHQYAVASLGDLAATQNVIVRTIIVSSALGVVLLSACLFVLGAYRRAMERGRSEELARLGRASLTDSLTGLGNHRAYQEDLERDLSRVKRHGGTLSLAVLDIDNFKGVNDRMGHVHGDRVLAALGDLLRGLRTEDRSFRLGGDEFGIILASTKPAGAATAMERLRQDAPARLYGATLSIGIASTIEGHGVDSISLRAQADAALYAAKHFGRNSIMTYADAHSNALVLSHEKEQSVRRLIDDGWLDVVFQPIWDVGDAAPLGFEALVRPPQAYSLEGPQEAFDVAERIGLAPALDAICLRAIFARAGDLPPNVLLFINIVPGTLDRDLVAGTKLVDAVLAAGLTPDRVVLELTERSMPHLDVIVREAKRLQGLGFKLALDDTGAGNAGLEVLRRLSVDFVKIDRTVLMQAMAEPIARAIMGGIVAIARAMDACVIAEGVETVEALDFVCREVLGILPQHTGVGGGVQGYLLGRPSRAPWAELQLADYAGIVRACENVESTASRAAH
jgi:diguanylate cyclase (GGDEF)-like protein